MGRQVERVSRHISTDGKTNKYHKSSQLCNYVLSLHFSQIINT